MKTTIFPFLMMILMLGWSAPASAQGQVLECGEALATELNTDNTADYCNFYDRRLDYAQKRKDLRNDIDQRRKNYEVPRNQAIETYRQDLEDKYYPKSGGEEGPVDMINMTAKDDDLLSADMK